MKYEPILVVGNSGKTGARVEQRLKAQGWPTRGVSRSSNPAFDWNAPDTWSEALEDVQSAYVTFYPDLAIPASEKMMNDFVEVAIGCGLKHMVLLSGRGEKGAERAEHTLQNSGLTWNVVRANWFMQNFSEAFMIEGVINGELMLPAGDIVEPFVDVDDIADVAVAALTQPELKNRLFEVSGPRALSFAQCAEEISEVTGYTVKYTQITIDEFLGALKDQGQPDEVRWLMNELFTVVFDGRNSVPTHGVMEALGRQPTDFKQYLEKVMDSGAWDRSGWLKQA
ncbi:MAG: NmrA family NAD(P)-binding protein [Pseudomonadota bacterium]